MQCPQNELKHKHMEITPYASIVESLMHAQTCTKSYISFKIGTLGKYQSIPRIDYWKATKKVILYLWGTKDFILIFKKYNHLEGIGYSNLDFARCVYSKKINFYLYVSINWRRNLMEKYKTRHHLCIHNRSRVCSMLWYYSSWFMLAKIYLTTWSCRNYCQTIENLLW